MSKNCSKWLNAEVWYMPDYANNWLAGVVMEAHENEGVWKFTIRPCDDSGIVTLWPQCHENNSRNYSKNSHVEFTTLKRRNLQDPEKVNDLTKLRAISEPELEYILSERYTKGIFYTEVGPVLLYLNFWGDLENSATDPSLQDVFEAGRQDVLDKIVPHPYKLAEFVYRAMNLNEMNALRQEDQTIILSGESGSGKTRNLHYLLEYLTYSSSKIAQEAGVLFAYDNEIEELIMAANVITTSFGCASTHEGNPSSSRFGQFIELYYSDLGYLEGSSLRTFLLETDRVTHQAPHQRNFNVFGEIAAGLNPYEKADFGFHVSQDFHYLGTDYTSVEGLTLEHDRHLRHYGQLRQAMTKVGMSPLRQIEALKVLVGILHLGNITFETTSGTSECCTSSEDDEDRPNVKRPNGEGVTFADSCCGHVDFACKILGFTVADLCGAITTKTAKVSGKAVVTQNDIETCVKVRDTLAKTLYHSLFKWIVVEINRSLSENLSEYTAARIGILDMFGFDSSEVNDFNQMCQNYANEILHCHFFRVILDGQTKIFDDSTEKWIVNSENAANVDSTKHIDVFESTFCGIFPTLNSVMHSSNPSVDQFVTILGKSNIGNPLLVIDNKTKYQFTIRHYAYDVTYNVKNIIDMNQGLREINFATLSTSNSGKDFRFSTDNTGGSTRRVSTGSSANSPSRSNTKKRLSSRHHHDGNGSPGSIGSKTPPRSDKTKYKKVKTSVHKKQPIAHSFMTEINELLSQIRMTGSHFIQCIKCTHDYNPDVYESGLVSQQLRYSACMQSIEALQNDLSLSISYKSFISEYSCLLYVTGKCHMTNIVYNGLQVLKAKPKNSRTLRLTALSLVEIIPIVGAILGQIEDNPFFVLSDQHCYDGLQILETSMKFSAEYLEYVESLKRSTIHIIVTRLQRVWKAHRLMLFKRYAQARGQHALVYVANLKYSNTKRSHTCAVAIQRRVRVYLAMMLKKRLLAEIAHFAALNEAAVKIQAFVRCELTRKNYARERTRGMAYAKLMRILGCDGDDMSGELALYHYQMDILHREGQLAN